MIYILLCADQTSIKKSLLLIVQTCSLLLQHFSLSLAKVNTRPVWILVRLDHS